MKNKVLAMLLAGITSVSLCGCNKQIVDTTYSFKYAYISLPNGECVEGKIESWTDFGNGDQLQVKVGGKMYLTDTTRCVLVR